LQSIILTIWKDKTNIKKLLNILNFESYPLWGLWELPRWHFSSGTVSIEVRSGSKSRKVDFENRISEKPISSLQIRLRPFYFVFLKINIDRNTNKKSLFVSTKRTIFHIMFLLKQPQFKKKPPKSIYSSKCIIFELTISII
jgi:hypothetical protein